MTTRGGDESGEWLAGWDAPRRAQRIRVAEETTPAERLAWLEEMIALAHRTGALPRRRPIGEW